MKTIRKKGERRMARGPGGTMKEWGIETRREKVREKRGRGKGR
jgi:hypothetical protein